MENNNFIALFLLVFVFGIVSTASAQERLTPRRPITATSTTQVRPIRLMATSTKERPIHMATSTKPRAWLASTTATRKDMMQEKRADFQQEAARRKSENVARVISATIERLEKIIERVESRIEKLKTNGGNTLESEGFIASAKVHLSEAKADVALFAQFDLTSEKAQENFEVIRTAAKESKEHIRLAHTDIMKATRLLGQVQAPLRAATTTNAE